MAFSALEYLRPKKINSPRQRLGSFHDGGYVVNDLVLTTRLYSFGVGDETSFDTDFIKREGAIAHLYDPFVDLKVPDILRNKIFFHKKLLAPKSGPNGDTIEGHARANNDAGIYGKAITVNMDVEGFELDYFSRPLTEFEATHIQGLLVEFHIYKESDIAKFVKALENISKHFIVYHLHANNWVMETFTLEGKVVPRVLEVGFVNKNVVKSGDGIHPILPPLPIPGLDYPCKPNMLDIDLTYLLKD